MINYAIYKCLSDAPKDYDSCTNSSAKISLWCYCKTRVSCTCLTTKCLTLSFSQQQKMYLLCCRRCV